MSEAIPPVGSLTDRVALQRRETLPEAEGGNAVLYVPITSLWARVRALGAGRTEIADGRTVAITHSVVVRFRTDISSGDRFGYRGRWLEVVGTEDLNGRRAWLGCRCIEAGVVG